jgi:hypothetical protein
MTINILNLKKKKVITMTCKKKNACQKEKNYEAGFQDNLILKDKITKKSQANPS